MYLHILKELQQIKGKSVNSYAINCNYFDFDMFKL